MSAGRILGVDYGERRVGLALSDPLGLTAQPLAQIDRGNDAQLTEAIGEIIQEHDVERVVVGMPVGLSGGDTARARRTRRLIAHLRRRLGLPVEAWDERLSTAEADRTLIETNVRPGRRGRRRDLIAAQLILQGYLDRRRDPSGSADPAKPARLP